MKHTFKKETNFIVESSKICGEHFLLQQTKAWIFIVHPTKQASTAQGLFLSGSGHRAGAHTRPAFSKNTYGPVGIPLSRGASGARQYPPDGSKSRRDAPPTKRPEEITSRQGTPATARSAPSPNAADQSVTYRLEWQLETFCNWLTNQ